MVNGFKVAKIYVQKYLELYSYTRLTYKSHRDLKILAEQTSFHKLQLLLKPCGVTLNV